MFLVLNDLWKSCWLVTKMWFALMKKRSCLLESNTRKKKATTVACGAIETKTRLLTRTLDRKPLRVMKGLECSFDSPEVSLQAHCLQQSSSSSIGMSFANFGLQGSVAGGKASTGGQTGRHSTFPPSQKQCWSHPDIFEGISDQLSNICPLNSHVPLSTHFILSGQHFGAIALNVAGSGTHLRQCGSTTSSPKFDGHSIFEHWTPVLSQKHNESHSSWNWSFNLYFLPLCSQSIGSGSFSSRDCPVIGTNPVCSWSSRVTSHSCTSQHESFTSFTVTQWSDFVIFILGQRGVQITSSSSWHAQTSSQPTSIRSLMS